MLIPIHQIPGVQFIAPAHRAYEYVLDFIVAAASVGKYLNAYRGQPVTTFAPDPVTGHQSIEFQGQASGKTVEFLPHDVLHGVFVAGTRTAPVPYLCKPALSSLAGASTGAVAETLEGFAQAMFTRYWENNLPGIVAAHGKRNAGGWPSVLQFGAVVRDTMSHGGTIHMFAGVPPASHFGLTYSPSANGRKVMHNDLSCGDIFLLLLDVDAAF